MNKQFVIVNYNTPQFIEKLIMSINKFVKDAHITVFDNSDKLPFVNTFDNVKVVNNTNGQIIDFDDFLNKYPKRNYSSAKSNNWASAKHCYTIQKCIDIADDNFILLDSDVILTKDVSELFDNDYIYVSEVLTQGNGLKRVAPYLCYINVYKCKQNNVKYFDERYMHGLDATSSDKYDTGGAFYINCQNYQHKDIVIKDYAIHYGHGSWTCKGYTYQLTPEEFFEKYKECWNI